MAGYIGTTPVPQATQHRESFTATGGQTSFATAGYTPQFIDVYLNGVKLAPADFTATNGSDVVLASGATASDILEIVAYTPFEVANQTFTGTTTAANLTVTGAFTSQGIDDNADAVAITIDSSENVGIGTSSPSSKLSITESTVGDLITVTGANGTDLRIGNHASANGGIYINSQAASDDLRFRTQGSDRMTIDSSGNVGIGTSSPSFPLSVQSNSSAEALLILGRSGDDIGEIAFRENDNSTALGELQYRQDHAILRHRVGDLRFATGGTTERMRIDSSGNLLVGKTSENTTTVGIQARADGLFAAVKASAESAIFGRNTDDGNIVLFRKDGTTVGGLSVFNSHIGLFQGGTRLEIDDGNDAVFFTNNSVGGFRDGTTDIGKTNARIKDLYLSGGVFLGGTGSANQLDDYEEGTWTPTISSGTFTAENAWYVKVGTLITISAKLSGFSDTSSGNSVTVGGVPFTTKASDHTAQGSMIADYLSNGPYFPYISSNATTIRFYIQSTTNYTTMVHSNLGSSGSFYFTLTYQTQ